jgi:hypothetical protein
LHEQGKVNKAEVARLAGQEQKIAADGSLLTFIDIISSSLNQPVVD